MSIFVEGIFGECLHLDALAQKTQAEPGDTLLLQDLLNRLRPQPDRLFLPACFNEYGSWEQNLATCHITLLRQMAYLNAGTLRFEQKIRTLRATQAKSKMLQPSSVESTALERRFASTSHPAFLGEVFNRLEERRIDEALRRQFPGARQGLQQVQELDRESLRLVVETGAEIQFPLKHTFLRRALEILQKFSLNLLEEGAHRRNSNDDTSSHAQNFSEQILQLAAAVTSEGTGVADSALAALQICELTLRWMDAADVIPPPTLAPEDQADQSALPPASGSNALQADSSTALDDGGNGAGGSAEEYADEPGVVVAEDMESLNDLDKEISPSKVNTLPAPIQRFARSFWYREWNYSENRYLEAWCRVIEQRLVGEDTDFISAVHRRHPKLWQQIKRSFALLRPASFKRVHRTTDGDELDLDRVIERQAERHIKRQQDDAVFMRRERALRDVSVAFLVDMSASTSILIPQSQTDIGASVTIDETDSSNDYPYLYGGGMSARTYAPIDETQVESNQTRRVIDVAQDAVALMSEALHHLGDDFAVYGFSGNGREQVDFFIAKEFEEHLSGRTWAALSAMQPKQSSRVGPAIRHSAHKILKHTTARRLLIVISDGYPQDREYGPAKEDVEYGIQDTAKALREAERQGVQTFFVTIDPAGYDYLGRMCPENRYLLIEDVRELPAALSKIYRSMKAAPSKQTSFSNTKTFSAG